MNQYLSSELIHEVINLRRDFHEHPELGFEEFRTSSIVANYLNQLPGLKVYRGIAQTGVVGVLDSGKEGNCVALRADMDALPIKECSSVSYKSVNHGVMHACGHDGHTAALLGTAKLLAYNNSLFTGSVVFIFQPAEEGLGGASEIIKSGILTNLGVQKIFGFHGWPMVNEGEICLAEGASMAASDGFSIKIFGQAVHASTPHLGLDPFYAMSHLIIALQSIPTRLISAKEAVVISIGKISGGTARNIIPDEVELYGTIRTLCPITRAKVLAEVENLVSNLARSFGLKSEFDCQGGYPPVINDPACTKIVLEAAKILGGCNYPYDAVMAGEDFSFYLEKFEGAFWFLGLGNSSPLHSSNFDFKDQVIPKAINMHCKIVEIANRL